MSDVRNTKHRRMLLLFVFGEKIYEKEEREREHLNRKASVPFGRKQIRCFDY